VRENWSLYVAGRYLMTSSGRKGHLGNLLAILGLVIGILTLVTVLTVMNGFQQGFITSINEVYSYHLRVEDPKIPLEEFRKEIEGIRNIKAVVPFADYQAILTSSSGYSSGIQIRFVDEGAARADDGFMEQITMMKGEFSFSEPDAVLLGADLARSVNVLVGDRVTLAFMNVNGGRASLANKEFLVTGIFQSGYYEYDRNMAFGSLGEVSKDIQRGIPVYGIKLNRHFRDNVTMRDLYRDTGLSKGDVVSWRSYNSAFFNALKIEKTFMLLIVGLIFIVVAVNIYHSMKRSVRERLEELALLKAIGGTPGGIRKVFLLQGMIIGLSGCLIGTTAGILISLNINEIMDFFILIMHFIRSFFHQIFKMGGQTPASMFYFTDIPVQIMLRDLMIINGAALFSILAAALGSVSSYANVNPAEVFRNE
jgi:lipoprotein-releasing system permease protein